MIATDAAQMYVDHWVILYGIPEQLLMNNGSQFVGKFFNAACVLMGKKLKTTAAYHLLTNGQTERYNKTIIKRLCHYIGNVETIGILFSSH